MDNEYKMPEHQDHPEQPALPEQQGSYDADSPQPIRDNGAPEPPASWRPEEVQEEEKTTSIREAYERANVETMASVGNTQFKLTGSEIPDYQNARNYFMAAMVVSVASIFIGGVIASAGAVICAFIASDRFNRVAARHADEPEVQRALMRSGKIAVGISVGVLILNIISLIFLYPTLVNTMQNGGTNLLGGSGGTTGTGTGNGTWG